MWLIGPPREYSPFALELECSTLPSNLFFQNLAPSVTRSEKPTAWVYWQRAWKKEVWIRRLCGRMSLLSTDDLGMAAWISSLRDSPASPPLLLESDPGSPTADGFGPLSPESSGRSNPEESSWRMFPVLSPSTKAKDTKKYSPRWPRWGSMQNGAVSVQPKWVPPTNENGSSFSHWPTTTTTDALADGPCNFNRKSPPLRTVACQMWSTPIASDSLGEMHQSEKAQEAGWKPRLQDHARTWPTPSATNMNDGETPETWLARAEILKEKHVNGNGAGIPLAITAQLWNTPIVGNADKEAPNLRQEHTLLGDIHNWPMPRGSDGEKGGPNQRGSSGDLMLPSAAALWATPASADGERHSLQYTGNHNPTLLGAATLFPSSLPEPQTEMVTFPRETKPSGPPSSNLTGPLHGRQLNPNFVNWLMGLPHGWETPEYLDCEHWVEALFHSRSLVRSLCCVPD